MARVANIIPLTKQGTNSTLFTECCGVAICDNQAHCPVCKGAVIGHDISDVGVRSHARWRNATRMWTRTDRREG